jgi:hypothetical protein
MADKKGSSSEKTLYCSFCGKSQHEVKKLIAGPSVFICDECIDLCNEIIRDELPAGDEARDARSDLPTPLEIKTNLDNYVIGQEPAKRMLSVAVYNHYKRLAPQGQGQEGRGRAHQEQHPPDRPHGLGQDAAGADAGAHARRSLRDGRRHHADRSRLRGRRRREHHPEAAAKLQLRSRASPARHRLHRRDRQDLAQVRQPLDHPRRVGRGRAAGLAEADRRHHGQRAAPRRAQAPEPGLPADRHDQHPVHLRRRLRRPREGHRKPHRGLGHRLRRQGQEQEASAASPRCSAKSSPKT